KHSDDTGPRMLDLIGIARGYGHEFAVWQTRDLHGPAIKAVCHLRTFRDYPLDRAQGATTAGDGRSANSVVCFAASAFNMTFRILFTREDETVAFAKPSTALKHYDPRLAFYGMSKILRSPTVPWNHLEPQPYAITSIVPSS